MGGRRSSGLEEKAMGKLGNDVRPNNGVIITFYVESSELHVHGGMSQANKIKQNPRPKKPQTARSSGYDRRAQLLAHAQELRKSRLPIHKQPEMKQNQKRPGKPETPARRRAYSPRTSQNNSQSQWKYERVKKQANTEKVEQPCCPKCFTRRNRDAIGAGESNSSFFKKLRAAMKDMAGRCKGNEEVEEKKALAMAHRSIPSKAD